MVKTEWVSPHDAEVDWQQVAHEERMRNWIVEDAVMDDEGSVETFDSALEEEESRVESFKEMLTRIDWVEKYGVCRTLHPEGNSSYMLPGCNQIKVADRGYLEKMIKHEERKEYRLEEEIIFFIGS